MSTSISALISEDPGSQKTENAPVDTPKDTEYDTIESSITKTDAYKLISLVFVLVLGTDTDLFTDSFLSKFKGTIRPDGTPSIKGTLLKALTVALLFAVIMYLVLSNVV